VDAATDEQEPDHRPGSRIVHHLVDADLVGARAAFEKEVVQEVEPEVAAREDVGARPEVPLRIHRERLLAARDEVVGIARIGRGGEWRCRRVIASLGRSREQEIDRVRDELDVRKLFGGDVGDEVVERTHLAAPAEIERLERVVHEGGHLSELATEQLLHRGRRVW
jgi:hypothetical protein